MVVGQGTSALLQRPSRLPVGHTGLLYIMNFLRGQRSKLQGLLRSRFWGLTQCHSVRASHKASPDSRGYRNRLHFLLGGAAKSLQGLMWDRSECSGHLCKQTYHTYWKTCLCGTESSRITKNLMQVGVKRVTKSQVLKSSEHKGVGSDVI